MRDELIQFLLKKYPDLKSDQLSNLISDQMLSPYELKLPKSVFASAETFIKSIFELRKKSEYSKFFQKDLLQKNIQDPGNYGICMSYDFHVDSMGVPKLIEINTNAAFLALGYELCQARNMKMPVPNFQWSEFRKCLEEEYLNWSLAKGLKSSLKKIIIVDENPSEQRLYAEFLVFREIFKDLGYESEILDINELTYKIKESEGNPILKKELSESLIYNRYTDFYFENSASEWIKKAYQNKLLCFSPHPYEYFMLADKQRLNDWNSDEFWNSLISYSIDQETSESGKIISNELMELKSKIKNNLPLSRPVSNENIEELWSQRKKLFFKPQSSFGSKQSYKGSSMSRKIVDDMLEGNFIAQEYVPADEKKFEPNEGSRKLLGDHEPQMFKYDLRFYTYKDQIQLVMARLYQGQVTNAKTLGGGFSPVLFVE